MTASSNVPNRLVNEKSPYLYAHAHNPVDWYPWGEEAFEKARREDKPVFLSIGYSTCHWCHVMERESFADGQVAALLNENFISVKVDREERPDVDSVYMTVCQALTGAGGWPLTIVMTPDKKPFFAGTYLSKEALERLVPRISDMWRNSRGELITAGDEIERMLNRTQNREQAENDIILDSETAKKAVRTFHDSFDEKYGGFGDAPKFPAAHNLLFLIEYDRLVGGKKAGEMVKTTLTAMYRGGIFDHIAGGFSRYSTDEKWLVPHFEKMLYDNALLAWAYLEAYGLYGKEHYKTAAQKIFSWAFAELSNIDGAFFCGQDADSGGVEGKYYAFSHGEIEQALGEEDAEKYRKYYGVTNRGNFGGKNILNLIKNTRFDETDEFIDECNRKMYRYRRGRTELHTDDKVLTSWNALMIIALVKAYKILGDREYLNAAKKTEAFISDTMTFAGRLFVRWRDGELFGKGKLDDYANYTLALLELYSADNDENYLKKAVHYANMTVEHFFDHINGGFYLYADDDERLISRPKEIFDNALPSGNSTAFMLLDRLRRETGNFKWFELYKKQAEFIAPFAEHYPTGCGFSLITVLMSSAEKNCKDGNCG